MLCNPRNTNVWLSAQFQSLYQVGQFPVEEADLWQVPQVRLRGPCSQWTENKSLAVQIQQAYPPKKETPQYLKYYNSLQSFPLLLDAGFKSQVSQALSFHVSCSRGRDVDDNELHQPFEITSEGLEMIILIWVNDESRALLIPKHDSVFEPIVAERRAPAQQICLGWIKAATMVNAAPAHLLI